MIGAIFLHRVTYHFVGDFHGSKQKFSLHRFFFKAIPCVCIAKAFGLVFYSCITSLYQPYTFLISMFFDYLDTRSLHRVWILSGACFVLVDGFIPLI